MAANEKFCLRWNDFESNVSTAFRDLREEKDFFDVTLACDDSQVDAHKVILAACSPFFRNVLRRNPHQHPLLYLKGVKYKELVCVLNFMYQGEVNVAQEELNTFLAVAEDLKVKGLTQGNSSSSDIKTKSELKSTPRNVSEQPAAKRPRPAPVQSYQPPAHAQDDDIQEVVPVKSEPGSAAMAPVMDNTGYGAADQSGAVALEETYAEDNYDYGGYDAEGYDDGSGMIDPNTGLPLVAADGNKDAVVESLLMDKIMPIMDDTGKRMWACTVCDYTRKLKNDVVKHVERRHLDLQLICTICKSSFKSRNDLKLHVSGHQMFR